MLKVLMAAPFEPNGRYKGGISSLVNKMLEQKQAIKDSGIEVIPFNTCRIQKDKDGEGKFNYQNIKNFFVCCKDAVKEIKNCSPDVLYYHSSVRFALLKDLLIIKHTKKKFKIKTAVHIHMADYRRILTGINILDKIILKLLSSCDKVVFLSKKTKDEFIELGLDEKKCAVMYNFSTLSYTPEEISSKKYRNNLLFVGAISERKGILDLMEALLHTQKEYSLAVCGGFVDGEVETKFREYLDKIGDKVRFLGYIDSEEKHKAFLDSDVLVLPSFAEGLPVVILEAFSAGNAVVATDVGAIPEILTKDNGHIISAGDVEGLRKVLEDNYLNGASEQTEKIKTANYEYSKEFTVECFIEKIAQVCKDCMKE